MTTSPTWHAQGGEFCAAVMIHQAIHASLLGRRQGQWGQLVSSVKSWWACARGILFLLGCIQPLRICSYGWIGCPGEAGLGEHPGCIGAFDDMKVRQNCQAAGAWMSGSRVMAVALLVAVELYCGISKTGCSSRNLLSMARPVAVGAMPESKMPKCVCDHFYLGQ
jgi:hypothetical protein